MMIVDQGKRGNLYLKPPLRIKDLSLGQALVNNVVVLLKMPWFFHLAYLNLS